MNFRRPILCIVARDCVYVITKKHLQELNAIYTQLFPRPLQSILYYTVLHLTLLIVNVC